MILRASQDQACRPPQAFLSETAHASRGDGRRREREPRASASRAGLALRGIFQECRASGRSKRGQGGKAGALERSIAGCALGVTGEVEDQLTKEGICPRACAYDPDCDDGVVI